MEVGFIGLGNMGLPMALNMARAGVPLIVWNRTRDKAELVAEAGGTVADSPARVFRDARTVFVMLANGAVIDEVLERGTPRFAAMVAGGDAAVDDVLPLLAPLCATTVRCGEVSNATRMKLAVNLFLIAQVTALAEAFHFAESNGLDLDAFRSVLDSGPMASAVSRLKLDKLVQGDFEVQASVRDVHYNSRLVADAARQAGASSPVIDACRDLFAEAEELGYGPADMVGSRCCVRSRRARGRGELARPGGRRAVRKAADGSRNDPDGTSGPDLLEPGEAEFDRSGSVRMTGVDAVDPILQQATARH